MTTSISIEDARHVLYFFGYEEGLEPGSFKLKWMEAFSHADMHNRYRMSEGHPHWATAMLLAYKELGVEKLKLVVERSLANG
jgi:hypothetical protein